MSHKLYGAFIVSTKPIKLGDLADDPCVKHCINEEFELDSNGQGGFKIEKSLTEQTMHKVASYFRAIGGSVSVTIAAWFHEVCRSGAYEPKYMRDKKVFESDDPHHGEATRRLKYEYEAAVYNGSSERAMLVLQKLRELNEAWATRRT